MIDIPESNSTGLSLAVRGLELVKREVQQNHTVSSTSTSTAEDWTRDCLTVVLWVMVLKTNLVGLLSPPWTKTRLYQKLFTLGTWVVFSRSGAVFLTNLSKTQNRSAASNFLATCKMQQVCRTSWYQIQIGNLKRKIISHLVMIVPSISGES
jgi:hypothetical protein